MSCRVCGKAGPLRCSRCKSASYCGPECQKKDWKQHKTVCGIQIQPSVTSSTTGSLLERIAAARGSSARPNPDPTQMASGMLSKLDRKDVFYHLVDAYRLRVDDEYTYTGEGSGIYGGDVEDAVDDFERFMALAKEKKILPDWWNQSAEKELARVAADLLPYALEKSDLGDLERYKSSPFISMELRMIAEAIYGSSAFSF